MGPRVGPRGRFFWVFWTAQNDIEKIIKNRKGAMPAGVITPEEAKIVAEWLAQKQ
ncbi:cytochrome c [Bacillus sp. 7884-1]|uniref:cytochrome c n=1 Tax=Bacillus sp. 7884-1 TaxID=2021693 RepID=UPI0015CE6AF7|nr:cytochrome c [Bacillus sp. 7884-1]